jgi:hypothetical protein
MKQHIQMFKKVLDFTWQGLEPTIYRTQGEHANQYTIDAVSSMEVMQLGWHITVFLGRLQGNLTRRQLGHRTTLCCPTTLR